ncbi:MAG: pyrroloquinoline quinone precursor peptide PqqA [Hyphomicrobium sp.]|jgi:pyrroloquinoline quinone biosynthesis protein A|nr:pyrroloquinoline quinone precursor peptide PqqA [Hyphomicrobium sp.]
MQECAVKENKSLTWTQPAYCDVRLGFEVTAYIYVR